MANAGQGEFELDRLLMAAVARARQERQHGPDVSWKRLLLDLGIDLRTFEDYFQSHKEEVRGIIEWIGF